MTIYTPTPCSLQHQGHRPVRLLPFCSVSHLTRAYRPANNIDLTQKEELRHILLGSPSAIRQVIHQLHTLHYVDPTLWSPITAISDRLIITPEQGEAISLLRRSL